MYVRSALNSMYIYNEENALFEYGSTPMPTWMRCNFHAMNRKPDMLPLAGRQVLNLRTLETHRRGHNDLFTGSLPFMSVLDGPFPDIEYFFRTLCNNDSYLVRCHVMLCCQILGAVTPSVTLHVGPSSCGVTTLFSLLRSVLGPELCVYLPPDVLTTGQTSEILRTRNMTCMANARLLYRTMDQDGGETLNVERLNSYGETGRLIGNIKALEYPQVAFSQAAVHVICKVIPQELCGKHVNAPMMAWPSRFLNVGPYRKDLPVKVADGVYIADPHIYERIDLHRFFSFLVHAYASLVPTRTTSPLTHSS